MSNSVPFPVGALDTCPGRVDIVLIPDGFASANESGTKFYHSPPDTVYSHFQAALACRQLDAKLTLPNTLTDVMFIQDIMAGKEHYIFCGPGVSLFLLYDDTGHP